MANKYLRKHAIATANTPVNLYTVPDANSGILSSLRVTNTGVSSAQISATVSPTGTVGRKVLQKYLLVPDGTLDVLSGVPLVLEAGDVLTIESSESNVAFWLSYLEVDRT